MSGWLVALFLLLGLGGWEGVGYLVLTYPPDHLTQTIFYALFFVAVTGTAVLPMTILHRVFPALAGRRRTRGVTLRQSAWIGLFAASVMGLRAARLRDLTLVIILGTILILSEAFWQQRGR